MEQRIRVLESQLKQRTTRKLRAPWAGPVRPRTERPARTAGRRRSHPAEATKDQKGLAGMLKPDWATPVPRDLTGKTARSIGQQHHRAWDSPVTA